MEGASSSQSRAARFACAAAVCKSQAESCEKVVAEASEEPLRFFIQNLMFDESTFDLRVGKDAANSCPVLCSHSQWTMGFALSLESARDAVRDEHIVRSPQVLAPMNSATMWKTLSCHPGSIGACEVAADHVCTLTTCDSYAANLKMLKHLGHSPPIRPLLPSNVVHSAPERKRSGAVDSFAWKSGPLFLRFPEFLNSRHAVQALRKRNGRRPGTASGGAPG